MKAADNRVQSVINLFRSELQDAYEAEEISLFCFLCFEYFMGFKSKTDLVLRAQQTMSESELLRFVFAVKELKSRKPIQYILGHAPFCGLTMKVDQNVLIPRPETEELVELVLQQSGSSPVRVLDIGTGSGCIAIALKHSMSDAEVFALDVSETALTIARQNASANGVNVQFSHFDILADPAGWKEGAFHLIVSNPPYIRKSEMGKMDQNVHGFEPHLALFVKDEDPLLFYRQIARFANLHLEDGGGLFLEVNEALGSEVAALLIKEGFELPVIQKDLNGKDRMVWCRKLRRK
ncbi:MAG TPA: peptide chain release factor N(5)-glutamine methyltransferase [Bacteroidia bacterium]|jgi:release factor glutamine methyltransferase|nr:peptide chain release factor N(5)-glutamine methyltransferase [Bacteroidia bacterium]